MKGEAMNGAIFTRLVTVAGTVAVLGISGVPAAQPASADAPTGAQVRKDRVGRDPFVPPFGRQDWSILNLNTGKCLEIENSTLDNGGRAQQWQCANIATMRWTAVPVEGEWYRLINANSGKCLEIENSSTDDGGDAQQWTCGSYNMQWKSVPASYGWQIVNRLSGKCLEIENSSGRNGARAQQWTCADIPTMEWRA